MNQLPIFLSVAGRPVLLCGGTGAAAAKLRMLARAGADVRLLAKDAGAELQAAAAEAGVAILSREFQAADADGARLAYVATGDTQADAALSHRLRALGLLVNVVDGPELSDFITPAIVDRAPVVVAIGTGGAAPVLARRIRATIDRLLPARLGEVAKLADGFRASVAAALPEIGRRRRFWDAFFTGDAARAALAGDQPAARSAAIAALNRAAGSAAPQVGEVFLVGAGPGDPELLTLKAHRLLQTADAVVYDELGAEAVVELSRRDAERHFVGKRKGRHSARQDEINALLVRLAHEGKSVVRLKGGDPMVFGRAAEEIEALQAAGITVSVVPGITAALASAAAAGVTLTHRDHAQAVTLVTAHRKEGEAPTDFGGLAGRNQTLAVYMGLSRGAEIQQQLIEAGWPEATPVVVVVDAGRPTEAVRRGALSQLGAIAGELSGNGPGLLLIGEAVGAVAAGAVRTAAVDLIPTEPSLVELCFLPPVLTQQRISRR